MKNNQMEKMQVVKGFLLRQREKFLRTVPAYTQCDGAVPAIGQLA